MKKEIKKIVIIFKGDFYGTDFFGYKSLKDLMKDNNIKRNEIKDWYVEY